MQGFRPARPAALKDCTTKKDTQMSKPDFGELMRLGWGFRASKLLLVANDWGLFSLLSPEPRTAGELAVQLKLDRRALEIMLNALVSIGLLAKEQDRYRNQELAETYLVKETSTYRGEIFKHLHQCWCHWDYLEEVIRTGHSSSQAKLHLSEERRFKRGIRSHLKGSSSRKAFYVPELCPRCRMRLPHRERVQAIGDHGGIHHVCDPILVHSPWQQRFFRYDRIIDGFQNSLHRTPVHEATLHIHDVPLVIAGLDHGL